MIGLNEVMTWSDIQYPERVGKAFSVQAPKLGLAGNRVTVRSFGNEPRASFQPVSLPLG